MRCLARIYYGASRLPGHQALTVEALLRANNNQKKKAKKREAALLGLGLDNEDGHTRLTRGKNFVLYGGSEETHAKMQETAVKINEQLDQRGKQLEDVGASELRDIVGKALE